MDYANPNMILRYPYIWPETLILERYEINCTQFAFALSLRYSIPREYHCHYAKFNVSVYYV